MISHSQFGELRLAMFLPDSQITELAAWEFMDEMWIGEAFGFSEWLRLEDDPNELRSMAIDFGEFPEEAAASVLQIIDLPVKAGMQVKELQAVLGEPIDELRFSSDRVTYEFMTKGPARYDISCTVLNEGGLKYLVIMRPLPSKS